MSTQEQCLIIRLFCVPINLIKRGKLKQNLSTVDFTHLTLGECLYLKCRQGLVSKLAAGAGSPRFPSWASLIRDYQEGSRTPGKSRRPRSSLSPGTGSRKEWSWDMSAADLMSSKGWTGEYNHFTKKNLAGLGDG